MNEGSDLLNRDEWLDMWVNLPFLEYHRGNLKIKMKNALLVLMLLLTFGAQAQVSVAPVATTPKFIVVPLQGAIDDTSAAIVVTILLLAEMAPPEEKPKAIIIDINSGGGEFDAGFRIVKAIERSSIPIICVVDGDAASMAFYILQSCGQRVMTARSTLMWHGVSLVGMDRINMVSLPNLKNRLETMNLAALAHVSKKLKIPAAEVAKKIEHGDWWMAGAEALDVGAVDMVIR